MSDPAVVTASRAFVCVRPQTYEDAGERDWMLDTYAYRFDELENTLFGLLAPDGEETLSRAGRSPRQQWSSPAAFATALERIASDYDVRDADRTPGLPVVRDVRLGLNVAACDSMPLAIVWAQDEDDRAKLAERAAEIAWSDEHVGRWHWVVADDAEQLSLVDDLDRDFEGVALVAPEAYGRTGALLGAVDAGAQERTLVARFAEALAAFEPPVKDHRAHVRDGRRAGITWDSALPNTDGIGSRDRDR